MKAALANCAWMATSLPSWARYCHALSHPSVTQFANLRRLLAENSTSAYGIAHAFDSISTYQQYRERVPVVGYEDLQPWIERIMRGEHRVLTNSPVTRLVPTSGSSGARKFIPFTSGLQREFNTAIAPWTVDLWRAHPGVALGPAYWSISPALDCNELPESSVPIGFDDDSAYLGGIRQRLVESTFAVPPALRHERDLSTSRYLTLLYLLRQPELRLISVWHPSFLSLLLDHLPEFWDDLLADVANGGCRRGGSLPASWQHLPLPQRAEALRGCHPNHTASIWPHLKVVSCWSDAQALLPFRQLQKRFPGVALQSKGLLATEGVVTIPFQGLHPIAIRSHFYEFADANGAIHTADQLQLGGRYTVILTTSGGLWRYQLGDEVEVDGFVGSTPSLRFLGRCGKVSDLCGEKLHESFVTEALAKLFATSNVAFAILAPETPARTAPHYTLFSHDSLPPHALERLEDELRKNPHYAHCRTLGQLGQLKHCSVAGDGHATLVALDLKNGRKLGDIKPQSLSTRTDLREHLVCGDCMPSGKSDTNRH